MQKLMYEARKQSQGGHRGTAIDPKTGKFTASLHFGDLRSKGRGGIGTAELDRRAAYGSNWKDV